MAVILQLKGPLAPLILSSGCCLDQVFVHILCYSPCMMCNCLATSAPGEGSGYNTMCSDKKAMGNMLIVILPPPCFTGVMLLSTVGFL